MKNRLPFIVIAAVVVALVAALTVSQRAGRRPDNDLSGTVEAYEVRVAAKVVARVIEVRCEEGQAVEAGDTMMLLDDSDYRSAALASHAQMQAAQANLSAAASRAGLADSSRARMERMYKSGNLTRQELDRVQTESRAAQEALAAAGTAVEATQAQADVALNRVKDCAITAPVSGTVSTVVFRLGETVLAGSTPITIIDLSQTWLTVYLSERLLGRVRLGDTVRVRIDAYPKKDFIGTVSFIADKAEFTPKDIQTREERINQVYRVKVALPNPDRALKPGMPADAVFDLR
jgi:HlyD family secretion protein